MYKKKHSEIPSNVIRLIRTALGRKQEDFADSLNISQSKLSKLENGRIKPSPEVEDRLLEMLNDEGTRNEQPLTDQISSILNWLKGTKEDNKHHTGRSEL